MRTSASGIDLIKRFEGLELEAYQDVAEIWTIGYGHTGPDVRPGMKITARQAKTLLRRDLTPREAAVRELVRHSLNQNEFDALVSFVYNVGQGAFAKSTALRRLNAGDKLGAAEALNCWNKATIGGRLTEVTGLTRRRAAESAVFMAPAGMPAVRDVRQLAENTRLPPIETTPRRGNLAGSRSVQGATVAGGAGVAASSMGRETAEERAAERPGDGEPEAAPQTFETLEPQSYGEAPYFDDYSTEAQIQFALTILIICAVAYIVFARIDDWRKFKR